MGAGNPTSAIDFRHPNYWASIDNWMKWRKTYEGGQPFRMHYLKQYTLREGPEDFNFRMQMSPIPAFAKSAITEIKNAIFQRLCDVVRRGGSESYQAAVAGQNQGVDRRGSTMNAFLGMKVITDLLVMGKVGIYVDNTAAIGPRLIDTIGVTPYLYQYPLEDIMSFAMARPDKPSEFSAVLLRDVVMKYDYPSGLPIATAVRYRRLWLDPDTGYVMLQFHADNGDPVDLEGLPGGPIQLKLTRIPFVLLDIGDSLIKDVCDYQIALLNLLSSDISYALRSNFPFFVRQEDEFAAGDHLKQVDTEEGTATNGGQGAATRDMKVGTTYGMTYGKNLNQPAFINPSPDPLKASMQLQEKMEGDIRRIVQLAVENLASSAEAKSKDNQGLEAGLSFIGLVLEHGERLISEYWAAYEQCDVTKRQIPTVKYPDRYSLKTDTDRIDESNKLSELMNKVPGLTVKREIAKCIVQSLLGGRVSTDTIETINKEIESAPYTSSDPNTIIQAVETGVCGNDTASLALGFGPGESDKAKADHAERLARIALAQGVKVGNAPASDEDQVANGAARGVQDLATDPNGGQAEKLWGQNVDMQPDPKKPVRGKGRKV